MDFEDFFAKILDPSHNVTTQDVRLLHQITTQRHKRWMEALKGDDKEKRRALYQEVQRALTVQNVALKRYGEKIARKRQPEVKE